MPAIMFTQFCQGGRRPAYCAQQWYAGDHRTHRLTAVVQYERVLNVGYLDAPSEYHNLARAVAFELGVDHRSAEMQLRSQRFMLSGGTWSRWRGAEHTLFHHTGLNIYVDHAIAGLAAIVTQGRVTSDDVEAFDDAREQRSRRPGNQRDGFPGEFAAWQALFGENSAHARAHDPLDASLAGAKLRTFDKFKNQHYRADAATIIVTGDIHPPLVLEHLEARFAERSPAMRMTRWNEASEPEPTRGTADRIPARESNDHPRVLTTIDPDLEQVQFRLLVASEPATALEMLSDMVLRQLISEHVHNLRTEHKVSYGANTYSDSSRPAWHVVSDIDARAARAVIGSIAPLLRQLRVGEATPELEASFEQVRNEIIQGLMATSGSPAALNAQFRSFVQNELPADAHLQMAQLAADLQLESVLQVARFRLDPNNHVVIVAGRDESVVRAAAAELERQ